MKKITILAFQNTIATTVMGPMDIFFQAGQLWNHIHGIPPEPRFEVEIASINGEPVRCLNNTWIRPHRSMTDIVETDLIIIPSITDIDKTIRHGADALKWIQDQHTRGAHVASICTGAFFLAQTGLLDNKTATTHWGFVELFRKKFPNVHLKPDRLITDEDTLFCAGALGAGVDLSIYLVEKYCGHETATQCSKSLIYDMGRNSQAPYSVFGFQKSHADKPIIESQKWIETHFTQEIDMNRVAKIHGMSRRTFERRFKKATGDTPLLYLQRTRIDAAKRQLEENREPFSEISYAVGYGNSSHFRELFKKHTGLLPTEYQKKFRP